MARGYCFGVTRDLNEAADLALDETDLYEYLGELGIDFAENEREPEKVINGLLKGLKRNGAEIGTEPDEEGNMFQYFLLSDTVKENIFRERLELLKKKAEQITLSQFSCGSGAVYALRETIEDSCGDCVCDETLSAPANMDTFIRYAVTNEKYYISPRVVLMH